MQSITKYALIVAGGSGSRMQSEIPKQFLSLVGRPILMHTIEAFYNYSQEIEIIIVLPAEQFSFWDELCKKHDFRIVHRIVQGGASRWHSVKNGLDSINGQGIVAIHDGVRPLTPKDVINRSFEVAGDKGNAITAVSLKDSIRSIEKHGSIAEDREKFKLIQTPQTFDVDIIKEAYQGTKGRELFTDDASVLESTGGRIHLIEGSYINIKVTTPEDLVVAEALLQNKS